MNEKFRELWLEGNSAKEIARELGLSLPTVYRTRERLMLPNRPREETEPDSPSPEEILVMTREFRTGWSEEERFKRWVGGPPRG